MSSPSLPEKVAVRILALPAAATDSRERGACRRRLERDARANEVLAKRVAAFGPR